MTNTQLYMAIGIPILFNAGMMMLIYLALNSKIDTLRSEMNNRFDDLYKYVDQRFNEVERRLDALEKRRSA